MAKFEAALILGILLAGCSQPSPPTAPANHAAAVEARLAADEARIAALEAHVNALQAPKPAPAPVATIAGPRGYTLTVTMVAEDQPTTRTHASFGSRAECETARQKALADAAGSAKASSQTRIEQLTNGAEMITPAAKPPAVTAICSG